MAPSSNIFRAARPLFRQSSFSTQALFHFRDASKRRQSTAKGVQQSLFKRMWESEIGFKTVHFWAPVMKWAVVIAGISDLTRPAERLSLTQNFALTCTGLIWTRWCLIIKPKNYFLAAANFFFGLIGIVQVTRILVHDLSKVEAITSTVEDVKGDVKGNVEKFKGRA